MMITRLTRITAVAVTVFAALASYAMAQTKPLDTTPAKIRFGYVTGVAFPTIIIAQARGYFAKENLTVENVYLAGTGPIIEALAAANLDMGNTTPLLAIAAAARGGQRSTLLSAHEYSFTDKQNNHWEGAYITVRRGEGIKELADFRGKRIAINDIGSSYTYFLRAKMIEMGMNPDKDITIIPVPFAQMAGALLQKQVDVIVASADGLLQARERAEVDVIGTQTSLEGLDISVTSSISINDEYFKKNRDVAVRFLRAELQARSWMKDALARNDPELFDPVATAMKYTPQRSKAFWGTRGGYYGKELDMVNLMDMPRRLIERQIVVARTSGLVPANAVIDPNKLIDRQPLQDAFASLGMTWDRSKE
jgi:ABC-type nitrate/sulfonate/bicarbonate transport system substrate-binding protein